MTGRFQILSLDGGGIKGLFSAAFLAHLEEDFGIDVASHFDLITGTSTGGIIALALARGMKPREVVKFYCEDGKRIFAGNRSWRRSLKHYLWGPKFEQRTLRESLEQVFGSKTLQDCTKRLVIPSFSLEEGEVHVFKTRHIERYTRDHGVPLWKVALATSAAPTYFPACHEVDGIRLLDGGVWANNPVMTAVVEAVGVLKWPAASVRVLSIGTSYGVKKHSDKLDRGGIVRWTFSRALVDVPFQGQSHGAIGQAKLLLGHDNVHRVDPVVPDGLFSLDDPDLKKLQAKASRVSRDESPKIRAMFLDHTADAFTPLPAPAHSNQSQASPQGGS